MDKMMNVIMGTDEGKFTLSFHWNDSKVRRRKNLKLSFPADKPKECLPLIQRMVKAHGKLTNILSSSSIDFPEEEGVTRKQVKALWDELGLEY